MLLVIRENRKFAAVHQLGMNSAVVEETIDPTRIENLLFNALFSKLPGGFTCSADVDFVLRFEVCLCTEFAPFRFFFLLERGALKHTHVRTD